MILQIIHLSDLHFEDEKCANTVNEDKIIQSLNSIEPADVIIIAISGDLAFKGSYKEYSHVWTKVNSLINGLKRKYGINTIEIVCVPGNHDFYYPIFERAQKNRGINTIESDYSCYLNSMKGFFRIANKWNCFNEDKIISKKRMIIKDKIVNFVMINTVPMSSLGGDAADMGSHVFSDNHIKIIEGMADEDINILVMHHSIEWFSSSCKDKLRKVISKKFSVVLSGHEHEPVGERRDINESGNTFFIQGNALYGYSQEGNGFCIINLDLNKDGIRGYSFIWNGTIYVGKEIVNSYFRSNMRGRFILKKSFLDFIKKDEGKRQIEDYYVFPGLEYNSFVDEKDIKKISVESEEELISIIEQYSRIVISGGHKSGKTTMAKRVFEIFLNKGFSPVLLTASSIVNKKIERIVEYSFKEQYYSDDDEYELFKQLDREERIIIIDEADLIKKAILDSLIATLVRNFGKIIVFNGEEVSLNVKRQLQELIENSDALNMSIKPFLYARRKELIGNILRDYTDEKDIDKKVKQINEFINSQIKYFDLTPDFIINFIDQCESDSSMSKFKAGLSTFSIVYENSIRNQIIEQSEKIDPSITIILLKELAYHMHFEKKSKVTIDEVSSIVEKYNDDYRQKANSLSFINAAVNAKILFDVDNSFCFKDHTLLAYFVAQALNQKHYKDDDVNNRIQLLLHNLCFGINSDIVLFLSLITDNPEYIEMIIDGANKHFEDKDEISFDGENVEYLMDTTIPVKDGLPTEEEKKRRDENKSKEEEIQIEAYDSIEVADVYDYSDEDLCKKDNQLLISYKYLEIVSKVLPAFCQKLKADIQDKIVSIIYSGSNKLLYLMLEDINNNFDSICNDLYGTFKAFRDNNKVDFDVDLNKVKYAVKQFSVEIIIGLYQATAQTCSSDQTKDALNYFNYESSSNYRLHNLMMAVYSSNVSAFSKKAQILYKKQSKNVERTIIKRIVQEYLFENNCDIYREAQSMIDNILGEEGKSLKWDLAKKKVLEDEGSI